MSSCQHVLDPKKYSHKDWISTETLEKIDAAVGHALRKSEHRQHTQTSTNGKKEQKSIQESILVTLLSVEAEEAAHRSNMRAVYANAKKLSEIFQKPDKPIEDKNRASIVGEGQRKRWVEHFKELRTRPAPKDNLPIICTLPTKEEIRKTIIQPKTGKAAEPDDIHAEALSKTGHRYIRGAAFTRSS